MKPLQKYLTQESLRGLFADEVQYKPTVPSHRRLYNQFVTWFKSMREKYNEDLILNMLNSAEEDIRYGEI